MAQKYYIDTCIWIDYFEDRKDKFRPLGEWALRLINNIIENEEIIVINDHLTNELRKFYSESELKKYLSIIPKKLIYELRTSRHQIKRAKNISNLFKIPFSDALHFVMAKENNAVFITRDKHFHRLMNFVEIKKPEELI